MITPSDWILNYWRRFWAKALLCLFVVFTASLWSLRLEAAPQWRVLETPRFTVMSQLSESETRAWVEEFNQFIEALGGVVKVNEKFLPKLTVVMFARDKDFGAYRPVGQNGKAQKWVAGLFSRQEAWGVIGMADNFEEGLRHIIFHEGVHWILSADPHSYPMWFNEGLAEMFSTFELEKGQAVFGKPVAEHVALLHSERALPIQRLLLMSSSDSLFNEQDRTSIFYAQSWAFVHYLIFGQRKGGHGTVGEFLTAYYGGLTTEEAFRNTFAMDFAAMDKALKEYLREGKYFISRRPLPAKAKITSVFQPATPASVQVALSRLAFGAGLTDKAKQHAKEAVRLDPNYAPGYTMLAWSLQYDESVDQFLESAEKAVQLGATDPESLALLALAKYNKAGTLGGIPPREARQIARLLERAINGAPAMKSVYCNLANVLGAAEKVSDQDLLFLSQGKKIFPEEPTIVLGLVQILRQQGQKEDAAVLLDKVLARPDKIPPEQVHYWRNMKSSWDVEDTTHQAADLMGKNDYKGALVILDALTARSPLLEARGFIAQQRSYALVFATLQDADRARDEDRKDEAAKLYQSILGMKYAPASVHGRANRELNRLKGSDTTAPEELDVSAEK